MTTLSERAMLVTLKISQWTAHKLDRAETTALNRSHGLKVEAARVHKSLLPFGQELERVKQLTGAIRKDFASRTLPWGIDGVNILKAAAYVEFTKQVNAWQDDWQAAVNVFLDKYPDLRHAARLELGTLFKEDDYPTVDELRDRFDFRVRFMPVPDDRDWRVDVGDEERERLKADIRKRLAETELEAMSEAYRRVSEVVEKIRERLSHPENIFRDSLVDNAVELCRILPMLNIADDPKLENARQQLERSIAPYVGNVDKLRHDLTARSQAAKDMTAILKKMNGAFGAVSLKSAA